jgi:hypothetical protein
MLGIAAFSVLLATASGILLTGIKSRLPEMDSLHDAAEVITHSSHAIVAFFLVNCILSLLLWARIPPK